MNSIHAIEERFGPDNLARGEIDIFMHSEPEGGYTGFTITDNGVGFTEDNLTSIRKFDSRKKAQIGGKGVGRLLWLKVSNGATVKSRSFREGEGIIASSFTFTAEEPLKDYAEEYVGGERVETSITVEPFLSEFSSRLPKRLDTIANRIIAHFVSYFTNMAHPRIVVRDELETVDLFDAFSDKVERDADYTFRIEGGETPTPPRALPLHAQAFRLSVPSSRVALATVFEMVPNLRTLVCSSSSRWSLSSLSTTIS
jgi:hypothetical protein